MSGDRHKRSPITLRPPDTLEQRLRDYARESGQSVSAVLIRALEQHLDHVATTADEAFAAWWPHHAVKHNSRSPVAAREAFDAGRESVISRRAGD